MFLNAIYVLESMLFHVLTQIVWRNLGLFVVLSNIRMCFIVRLNKCNLHFLNRADVEFGNC